MDKKQIVSELIEYITDVESRKGELTLFTWSHSLRCKIEKDYGITDLNMKRRLYIEAYNATHPNTPYEYKPIED